MVDIEIPKGSKVLKKVSQQGAVTFLWYRPNGGIFRYLLGLFLFAWLGGWFFGFKSALDQVFNKPDAPQAEFLIFWLVAWTVGGCSVIYSLFLIFRPQKPEKITFHAEHLEYDTGTYSPLSVMFNSTYARNPFLQLTKLFERRKVFSRIQKGEVKFNHETNPSRIYFDLESKRYEIGIGLSEPEIDWLYTQLSRWSQKRDINVSPAAKN